MPDKKFANQSGICSIYNTVNGRFYICLSSNFTKALSANKISLERNKHPNYLLQEDFNKFGKDSFTFRVDEVLISLDKKEMENVKKKYLEKYFDNGIKCYNLTKEVAFVTKVKKNTQKINQLNIDGALIKTWDMAECAAKALGISEDSIIAACRGHKISFKGSKWRYSDPELANQYTPKEKIATDPEEKKILFITMKDFSILEFGDKYFAAKHFNNKPDTIRMFCSETNRFFIGNREGLKYYKEGFFVLKHQYNKQGKQKIKDLKVECKICGCKFHILEGLGTHLQTAHNLSSIDYTKKYICKDSSEYTCKVDGCHNETRYCTYTFKDYCKEHAKIAMSIGGKEGYKTLEELGSWNKGKTKYDDPRLMASSILMSGANNHFYGKRHSPDTIKRIVDKSRLSLDIVQQRLEAHSHKYDMEYDLSTYERRDSFIVKTTCKKCGTTEDKTAYQIDRGNLCRVCFPNGTSKVEQEIGDWIESLGFHVERNNRKILGNGKEVDIYVPGRKFAIEYHGLYWHCNRGQEYFDKASDYKKCFAAYKSGIDLIIIHSDEWATNESLWKEIILRRLNPICLGEASLSNFDMQIVGPNEVNDFIKSNDPLFNDRQPFEMVLALFHNKILLASIPLVKEDDKWIADSLVVSGAHILSPNLMKVMFDFIMKELDLKKITFRFNLRLTSGVRYNNIENISRIKYLRNFRQWFTDVIIKWKPYEREYIPDQMFELYDAGDAQFKITK